jgi:rsbT co-antagonist protein RsbR
MSQSSSLAPTEAVAQVNNWLKLCQNLNGAKGPQDIVDVVVESLSVSNMFSCSLMYIDLDKDHKPEWVFTVGDWQRTGTSNLIGQRFYLPDFAMAKLWMANPNEPIMFGDVKTDPRMDPYTRGVYDALNTHATAIIPLVQAGRWVGLISIAWTETHKFTDDEIQLFKTVQVLISASVENQRLLDDKNLALEDLQNKLETIERQAQAIQELSTPVIEIWDDVLVMPVVGIVDTRRSKDIMDSLLHRIVETQSKCAIIDVTGVEIVDTMTADYLLKVVRAARLLGARCVLTGLTPAVAQTLVETGAALDEVPTLRNLKEGLKDCLRFLHQNKSKS